jgi:hypothetical protein
VAFLITSSKFLSFSTWHTVPHFKSSRWKSITSAFIIVILFVKLHLEATNQSVGTVREQRRTRICNKYQPYWYHPGIPAQSSAAHPAKFKLDKFNIIYSKRHEFQ